MYGTSSPSAPALPSTTTSGLYFLKYSFAVDAGMAEPTTTSHHFCERRRGVGRSITHRRIKTLERRVRSDGGRGKRKVTRSWMRNASLRVGRAASLAALRV